MPVASEMMSNASAVAAKAPAIAALHENGVFDAVPAWITSTFSPRMAVSDMVVVRRAPERRKARSGAPTPGPGETIGGVARFPEPRRQRTESPPSSSDVFVRRPVSRLLDGREQPVAAARAAER